jgi:hypothetical protein
MSNHDSLLSCPGAGGGERPPKARGELAEAMFVAKAMSLGFAVSKPFGDSAKYDFIVDAGGRLSRVQVKSAWVACRGSTYQFAAAPARTGRFVVRPYRRNEIDFLVAYVVPEDIWYIIPIAVIIQHNHLLLKTSAHHALARYREAWGLLAKAKCRPPPRIRARLKPCR